MEKKYERIIELGSSKGNTENVIQTDKRIMKQLMDYHLGGLSSTEKKDTTALMVFYLRVYGNDATILRHSSCKKGDEKYSVRDMQVTYKIYSHDENTCETLASRMEGVAKGELETILEK